ncbi:MAG: hypothetical protein FJ317_09345 [SAR202 cluster bacterium]|nr:hypothetical protein [SAR202 cluster bacterium]
MKPDYTSIDTPAPTPDRPGVLLNMVMSLDGKVVIEGTEQGIGSSVDQLLMRELRVNADVVLNGAGTLRASGTSSRLGDDALARLRAGRGKPRLPTAAVLSASGDLPFDRTFFTARDFDAIVYMTDSTPADRQEAARITGRPLVILPAAEAAAAMLRHMRQTLAAEVLLVEGGPAINAALFALDAVDEVFLTVGPVVVGGQDTLTPVGGTPFTRETAPRFSLVWAHPNSETGEVYLRYRRQR